MEYVGFLDVPEPNQRLLCYIIVLLRKLITIAIFIFNIEVVLSPPDLASHV